MLLLLLLVVLGASRPAIIDPKMCHDACLSTFCSDGLLLEFFVSLGSFPYVCTTHSGPLILLSLLLLAITKLVMILSNNDISSHSAENHKTEIKWQQMDI